jgi:hypothetical protein
VVIKEPSGSQSADLLLPALPESRLLFLLRDGRDVVDSELAANRKGSWVSSEFPGAEGLSQEDRLDFVIRSAQKWLWRTEVVESAYRSHPGPKHLVTYEQLLADPVDRLSAVFEWLDLPADDGMVRATLDRHSFASLSDERRGPDKFFRAATPGLWREHLTAEEQSALDRILGRKLRALGYEV